MMLQPPAGARIAPQSVPDVARALEEFYPGSGYADVMRGGPRMPTELATTTVTPAPLKEFQENFDFGQNLPPSETGGLGTRILEGVFGGAVQKSRDVATQGEQLRDLREGMTSGPGAGLDAITGDNLLPSMGAANTEVPTRGPDDGTRGGSPVAPEVTDVPVEPARDEASRKLLREDRKAAPPAKTPAPKLDFEDPNTFDTNYKTVMSRLEGVMGTGSKSSREDAMANLAMIGFAIAAGQSPDALTNIAQGALTGMKAVRAEKRDREEQEKALRMLGITTAMDMTAAADAAAATAARDDLAFERGLITEAEKSRLAAEREIAELQERARLGLGTGEGSVFNRSETPQEVYMKTLQTVRDAAPGTIGDIPEGMSQSVYAQRLAAQDALRHIEGLITMRILTDPDQIAAQQQLYQSRLDSTLTAAEIEQALTDGS